MNDGEEKKILTFSQLTTPEFNVSYSVHPFLLQVMYKPADIVVRLAFSLYTCQVFD